MYKKGEHLLVLGKPQMLERRENRCYPTWGSGDIMQGEIQKAFRILMPCWRVNNCRLPGSMDVRACCHQEAKTS